MSTPNILSALFVFSFGFVTCLVIMTMYGTYLIKKQDKKRKAILEELEKQTKEAQEKMLAYKDRLVRVQELTKLQMEMAAQLDEPSKNALHSKYKNGLSAEIKSIEEEKTEILRSILKDGFDPVVTILNSKQEREEVKLSEYMVRAGYSTEGKQEEELEPGVKKVGKFIVYNGGGNDTTH